jgi:hypothetical protein
MFFDLINRYETIHRSKNTLAKVYLDNRPDNRAIDRSSSAHAFRKRQIAIQFSKFRVAK